MAYNFPATPTPGQLYPSPAEDGKMQYKWDATSGVWEVVQSAVLTNSQDANNGYVWPSGPTPPGTQLTTNANGVLSWSPAAIPVVKTLSLLEGFDNTTTAFTLLDTEAEVPYSPSPSSNLIVFLGGVPQIRDAAYSVSGSEIVFTEAPIPGTVFSAFTLVNNSQG